MSAEVLVYAYFVKHVCTTWTEANQRSADSEEREGKVKRKAERYIRIYAKSQNETAMFSPLNLFPSARGRAVRPCQHAEEPSGLWMTGRLTEVGLAVWSWLICCIIPSYVVLPWPLL